MPDSNPQRRQRQIEKLRLQLAQPDGLAFADVLPPDQVQDALLQEAVDWRTRFTRHWSHSGPSSLRSPAPTHAAEPPLHACSPS